MKKRKSFSARVKNRILALYLIHGRKWTAILNDLIEEQKNGKISAKERLPADERTIRSYIEESEKRASDKIISQNKPPVVLNTTNDDLVRKHDIGIFEKCDEVMSERDLTASLHDLSVGLSYEDSKANKLRKFILFFEYDGNQYIESTLKTHCIDLLKTLIEITDFVAPRTRGSQSKCKANNNNKEFEKLANAAREAYRKYRVYIRDRLFR